MRFFKLIHFGIDIAPLLTEVREQDGAWLANTSRQDKIRVQSETNTIFIRSGVGRPDVNMNDNHESEYTKISQSFPKAMAFMQNFASEMNAELSRATIVRLKPKSQVYRHVDSGSYYFIRDRYHLVLFSSAGSVLASGDEQVRMQAGELWWFNNKQYHEAFNESDEWRIHYIFDLLPAAHKHLSINPILPLPAPAVAPPAPEVVAPQKKLLSARDFLFAVIRDRAILRSENQRLIGRTGKHNSWLIDIRRIVMDTNVLDAFTDLFWDGYASKMPFQIGGMEVAAIPLVTALLMKARLRGIAVNGFIVRKERKTYGTGSLIEGAITDAPIVIVDDILNSGGSLDKVRAVLEQTGKKIAQVFTLIDYQSGRGKTWRNRHRISVVSPFKLTDFDLNLKQTDRPPKPIFQNVWNFAAPDPNFFHRVPKSFPATDGKQIYFGSDCGIFWCLNAQNGSVVWTFKVNTQGHKNIWSAPAIYEGKVFFGSYDGNVYCLDAADGKEEWRYTGADWVGSSPALAPELEPVINFAPVTPMKSALILQSD